MKEERKNSEKSVETYMSRLKDGCILLSHESLEDPNFRMTVVLLCVFNNDGAFGLICNRPSHMPLSEVFTIDTAFLDANRPIYIGGPVDQESLHIIQLVESGVKHSYRVAPGVFLGGEWDSVESILTEDISTTRLFLGYSGWGTDQLEREVEEGVWEVYSVNTFKFLKEWEEPLFNDLDGIRLYLQAVSE
ncbi:MAG: YqgE/AlgH family protein [Chitinivibrionales bacterium]|nr:YqgE/AlgH family protein [Chitinivibrionales bacterium]